MFLGYPLVSNMAGWQLAGKSTMNGGFKLGKSPVNRPFSRHVWFADGRRASFCESSLTSTRSWEHEDTDFDQGMVGRKWKKHKFLSFILWYHQTWQWKMVHLYGWFMGDCPVLSYWTKKHLQWIFHCHVWLPQGSTNTWSKTGVIETGDDMWWL